LENGRIQLRMGPRNDRSDGEVKIMITNAASRRQARSRSLFRAAILSGVATLACPGIARAQDQQAPPPSQKAGAPMRGLEQIVVTARRTSENVQTTPVSVTAVSSAQIKALNITRLDKLQQLTPNLTIVSNGPSSVAPILFMRGIGSPSVAFYSEPPVGIYIDGVYTPRPTAAAFDLPDLAGAEVLRGPQGTLFGRNTTGGAILLKTTPPSDEAGGELRTSYGSNNDLIASAVLQSGRLGENGPKFKLVLQDHDRDGWVDFPGYKKNQWGGSLHSRSGSFTMAGNLTPSLSFEDALSYNHLRSTVGWQTLAANPTAISYLSQSPTYNGPPFLIGTQPIDQVYRSPNLQANQARIEGWGDRVTIAFDGGKAFQLKSISGFSSLNENLTGQLGGSYVLGPVNRLGVTHIEPITNLLTPNEPGKQSQFSEELNATGKVGDFSYIAGLYYFHEHVLELIRTIIPSAPTSATSPLTLADKTVTYSGNTTSYAGYGQLSYKPHALDEKLEVSGGIRFTHDDKNVESYTAQTSSATGITTFTGTSVLTGLPTSGTGGIVPTASKAGWKNVGWSGSISYAFTPSVYLFARASSAFRAGGFNAGSTNAPAYGPEKAISYEGGIKTEWFDHHVRLNVVGYHTNYKGLQLNQFFGPPLNTNFISNAGTAVYDGIEAEFTARYNGLSVDADFGRIWPKYDSYLIGASPLPAVCATNPGNSSCFQNVANVARFAFLSRTSFHVGAQYATEPTPIGVFTARVDYSYRSSYKFGTLDLLSPNNAKISSGPDKNLSARLILSEIPLGRTHLSIQAFGDNLTNNRFVTEAIDFSTTMAGSFNRPRSYGVIATEKF
jgi:iron complex outermembrane receptor protein